MRAPRVGQVAFFLFASYALSTAWHLHKRYALAPAFGNVLIGVLSAGGQTEGRALQARALRAKMDKIYNTMPHSCVSATKRRTFPALSASVKGGISVDPSNRKFVTHEFKDGNGPFGVSHTMPALLRDELPRARAVFEGLVADIEHDAQLTDAQVAVLRQALWWNPFPHIIVAMYRCVSTLTLR